jgi:hypothetical protein
MGEAIAEVAAVSSADAVGAELLPPLTKRREMHSAITESVAEFFTASKNLLVDICQGSPAWQT